MNKLIVSSLLGLGVLASSNVAMADNTSNYPVDVNYPNKEEYHPVIVPSADRPKVDVGFNFGLGWPEGVALGLTVRPMTQWVRLNLDFTYVGLAGVQGGVVFDPINFPVAPVIALDGGFVPLQKLPISSTGSTQLPNVGFDYINPMAGLEFGNKRRFRFGIYGGYSWFHFSTSNFQNTVNSSGVKVDGLTVSNPSVNAATPSAKISLTWVW